MCKILTNIIISFILLGTISNNFAYGNDTTKYSGKWTTNGTKCVLTIETIGSIFEISAEDTSEKKHKIDVTNIFWDGEYLYFTLICKSNGWTTHHKMYLENNCVLIDDISGNKKLNSVKWKKYNGKCVVCD